MPSAVKENIVADMKIAMRSQEKERLGTIRLILAALKQKEVDERIDLNDEQVLSILNKMIKQRRDSISQYQAGNRPDLVEKEEAEVRIIQTYLPKQLSEHEVDQIIDAAIKETGAATPKDMGKVMSGVKPQLQGKADMTIVSQKVKQKLQG